VALYNTNPPGASCLDEGSLPLWEPLHDCVCSACGSCQSWCATGEWPDEPYACVDCIYAQTGLNEFIPDPACVPEAVACDAD
jgi:hypothetical protein